MSSLGRRLRKLESRLTDHTGLVPDSPARLACWRERIGRILDSNEINELIPLAVVDAILGEAEQHGGRDEWLAEPYTESH